MQYIGLGSTTSSTFAVALPLCVGGYVVGLTWRQLRQEQDMAELTAPVTPFTWAAWDSVQIVDGRIVAGGEGRFYCPANYPEVVDRLCRVDDAESLVKFVQQYGPLGQAKIRVRRLLDAWSALLEAHLDDAAEQLLQAVPNVREEVQWSLEHARTVRMVRDALAVAQDGSDGEVSEMVKGMLWRHIAPSSVGARGERGALVSWAEAAVRSNLRMDSARPVVNLSLDADMVVSATATMQFHTLIQWVYFHVASRTRGPWVRCPMCGQFFQKPHGRQEYCPGMPCRNNYAAHKKRNTDAVLKGLMTPGEALARFNGNVAVPATMGEFVQWVEEKRVKED